jgi:RNA polymerase sigma factor (sigma-70 family)
VATVPAEVEGPSDAELIDAVRKGTTAAYGQLYQRHVASAYNLARQLSRSPAEADDLVSEAFAKVLDTLRAGRGPDSAFRAYLLTALRHTAYDKTRRDKRVELTEDVETTGVKPEAVSVPFTDPAVAGLERSLAARAFSRLPERWQAVLWHTEVEGQSPAEVAPILGLTANGVSALAYRAREGLKQAYLQVYLADNPDEACRAATDRLGAWVRGGLSKRETAQVEAHLDGCVKCRALAAELRDVNSSLRVFIAPLVLGAGTVGYLTSVTSTGAVTGGAVVAGAAAGTAAGGSSSGAAGAGASLPRQFLGAAGAAAAVAVAIAIALTSGGVKEIPRAQQPPPPAPTQQPPTANPPTPAPPSPNSPSPSPPSPSPSPPSPSPSPTPGPPSLSATPPGPPISLIAGGAPVDLPLTVTNQGASPSPPVAATLALPPGVSAIPAGTARLTAPPLLRLDAPPLDRLAATSTVPCPGGTGTVTCRTTTGLAPGDSVTLLFRLVAAAGSAGGVITGTVSGGTMTVQVRVQVVVQAPAPVDAVNLLASAEQFGILLPGLLGKELAHITATNTGTSAKPITVTVDQPAELISGTPKVSCVEGGKSTTCTTTAPVPPGGVVTLTLRVSIGILVLGCPARALTVSATLGSATRSQAVKVDCVTLPILGGLAPVTTTPPKPSETPPRPPIKPHLPHLQPTPGAPVPATPAPPPQPLPSTQMPIMPPPDKPDILPSLGWLLPL